MRLSSIKIDNYRTLESIDLRFPSLYSAICGPNDSGKTNVVRAIRGLVRGETPRLFIYHEEEGFSLKDDYPKWKESEPAQREITLEIAIELDKERDFGMYQFVTKQLSIGNPENPLRLSINVSHGAEKTDPTVVVTATGSHYSDLNAQEILKKLQSSRGIFFHNSTATEGRYVYPGVSVAGYIREITGQHDDLVAKMKKTVDTGLARISRSQQAEFEGLLGRLQTKYKVGLSMPAFDIAYMPYSITLGERKFEVPLDDWGSGTKNRTLVLLTLFRARQIGDSDPSASKITPVIIVEEPESFLHPSAQAEFGRILQDLAEEFQVQVIVTTHSPYLLNIKDPASNILLRRRVAYRQLRDTELVDTTGENWMAPFGQALGLDTDEFKPWKDMMLTDSDAVLLVEGDTDKEYFEMLCSDDHGDNRLLPSWRIASYGGFSALCNTVLLGFVKNLHRRFFVTFDLDATQKVERTLKSLQLEKGKHFMPIGLKALGKRSIEGLLPEVVTTAVHSANPDLVQAASFEPGKAGESARNRLKRLYLEMFKEKAVPGDEYYANFYPLIKVINKALA